MYKYIPISYFIIGQALYDGFAPLQNTNWSIFYFTNQYISWLLLIILLPKGYKLSKKLPYFVIAGGLLFYIIIQLSKIGMDYENYLQSVNDLEAVIVPIAAMLTGLTYFIGKYVNNERLFKSYRNGCYNIFSNIISKCINK